MDVDKLKESVDIRFQNYVNAKRMVNELREGMNMKSDIARETAELFKPITQTVAKAGDKIIEASDAQAAQGREIVQRGNLDNQRLLEALLEEVIESRGDVIDREVQVDRRELPPTPKSDVENIGRISEMFTRNDVATLKELSSEGIYDFGRGKGTDYKFVDPNELDSVSIEELGALEDKVNSKINFVNGLIRSREKNETKGKPSDLPRLDKYRKALAKYISAIYRASGEKTGSGIRQPKRNAYKIRGSGYGQLMVDVPRLLDSMVLHAYRGGSLVYNRGVDRSTIDLLTKRYNPRTKYSPLSIEVFNDLNTLSGLLPHPSSGKSKLLGAGINHFTNPSEILDRLEVITGSRAAGNTNIGLRNEAWTLVDKLLHLGIITRAQHNAYVNKHLR